MVFQSVSPADVELSRGLQCVDVQIISAEVVVGSIVSKCSRHQRLGKPETTWSSPSRIAGSHIVKPVAHMPCDDVLLAVHLVGDSPFPKHAVLA